MEEKQTPLGIHALIYGIGTGLALIVFSLILYVANLYLNQWLGYVSYLIILTGMIVGTLQYRKVQMKGFMTYGKAFSSTFLIALFASIVSIIFFFFYIKYINTGFIQELLAQARVKMEAKAGSMSPEDMERAMAWTEKFMSPIWMMVWGFVGYVFISTILALLSSIFLQKKDPNAPTMI